MYILLTVLQQNSYAHSLICKIMSIYLISSPFSNVNIICKKPNNVFHFIYTQIN